MNYARMLLRLICVGGLGRWIPHRHDGRSTRSRVALASAWSVLGLATLAGGWSLVAPDHSPPPEPFTRASFIPDAAFASFTNGAAAASADRERIRQKYFSVSPDIFSTPRPLRFDPWIEQVQFAAALHQQHPGGTSASDGGAVGGPAEAVLPPSLPPRHGMQGPHVPPPVPSGALPHQVGLRTPVEEQLGPVLPPALQTGPCCDMQTWSPAGSGPSLYFGQGKYVSPERTQHVPVYRLRPGDRVECVFRITRDETNTPYQLNVGDQVRIESLTDKALDRELEILNDGTITLRLLGRVHAARLTVDQLQQELQERYKKYYRNPEITVTPLRVNTRLQDIINSVDSRAGLTGGQVREVRVTPDGTLALPAIGSVPAQGLSLEELKQEIDARYAMIVQGLEITPILLERAPRYVYVLGEVRTPGRFELSGPTTVMQALAMAGGIESIAGSRLGKVVIFRRDAHWRLVATQINLWHEVAAGKHCSVEDLWVADSDVVVVPKTNLRIGTDFVGEIFTRGIYGVMPFQGVSMNFAKMSTL